MKRWVNWVGVVRRGRGGGSRGVGQMDRTGLYGNRCAGQIGVNW